MREPASDTPHDRRIPRAIRPWSAFAYHEFLLLWFGMLVSQLGTWMQFTSLTYLVGIVLARSPAESAFNLGLLGAARAVPVFLFGPFAGYVADRFPRRRTVLAVNLVRAALALALAVASQQHAGWVLPVSLAIAGLFAAAQTFDSPARQTWISHILPRHLLSNGLGLNSIANNTPLMIGPAIAGILIGTVGLYVSFYVQAVTQWAVVAAVLLMKPPPLSTTSREPMFEQIAQGVRFIVSHAVLRWVVLVVFVTCLCVRPYTHLLATYAGHVLHVDAGAYGTMLAVGGIGTVSGAMTTAMYPTTRGRSLLWFASGTVTGICLCVLGYVHSFPVVLALLTLMGWGTMAFLGSTNVLIQLLAPEEMRGRALSLYVMIILGIVPLGTLVLGTLASAIGIPPTYALGGATGVAIGMWVFVTHPAMRRA